MVRVSSSLGPRQHAPRAERRAVRRRSARVLAACAGVAVLVSGVPALPALAQPVPVEVDIAASAGAAPETVTETAVGVDGRQQQVAADKALAEAAALATGQRVEVLSERTVSTSTWANPDGSATSLLGVGPLWVRRGGDGLRAADWSPINLTLRTEPDGAVVAGAHPGGLRLSGGRAAGLDAELATVGDGRGASFSLRFDGALPAPRLEGPRAVYANVRPNTDLVIEATRTGFEQFFVVRKRPLRGQEPDLRVQAKVDGATARQAADGNVEFVAADGSTVLGSIPAATAWDAGVDTERLHPLSTPWTATVGESTAVAAAPSYLDTSTAPAPAGAATELVPAAPAPSAALPGPAAAPDPADLLGTVVHQVEHAVGASRVRTVPVRPQVSADRVVLDVRPEVSFLQDSRVTYPVVVDPAINLGSWFDTYVDTGYSTDRSAETELRIGNYGSGVARSWLNVGVGMLRNTRIDFARLDLWSWHSYSCDRRVWQVWHADQATTGSRWSAQPVRHGMWSESDQTRGWGTGDCGDGWVNADITRLLQAYADNGNVEVGLSLSARDEGDLVAWKRFNSGNAGGGVPGVYVNYRDDCTSYNGPNGRRWVCGSIRDKYNATGGPNGPVGLPVSDEACDGVGCWSHFTSGIDIFWSPATGAHTIGGAIRQRWIELDWQRGLGYPTTDETGVSGGAYNHFERGSIYWSPASGAWEVRGKIRDKWAATGWETGPLGFPAGPQDRTARQDADYQIFSRDAVMYLSAARAPAAYYVQGAVRAKYAAMGHEASYLGYPIGDPTGVTGGSYNDFSGGSIYSSPTTGAYALAGADRQLWLELGGADSHLGLPTSDQYATDYGTRTNFQTGQIIYEAADDVRRDCTLTGTAGNDVIVGTDASDIVCGLGGADDITAAGGEDVVFASSGNDTVSLGDQDDMVFGGSGDDRLDGGTGTDLLAGDEGADTLIGGEGDDTLQGGPGPDTVNGGLGNDVLDGQAGADVLSGEMGFDDLRGGEDADRLLGGPDDDRASGGDGNDNLAGEGGGDVLTGGVGLDVLDGGTGADALDGGPAHDQVTGGSDVDQCVSTDSTTVSTCEVVRANTEVDTATSYVNSLAPVEGDVTAASSVSTGFTASNEEATLSAPHNPGSSLGFQDVTTVDGTSSSSTRITMALPAIPGLSDGVLAQDGTVMYDDRAGQVDVALQVVEGSLRVATVIQSASAPSRYAYSLGLPTGSTLAPQQDGSIVINDVQGSMTGALAPAWAQDANGVEVPTRYEVSGTTVTQVVDLSGANTAYPVVADPWLGFDLFSWTGYNRKGTYGNQTTVSMKRSSWGLYTYYQLHGNAVFKNHGWRELIKKRPTADRTSVRQQYNCHVDFAYVIVGSGWHWDLEYARPIKNNWFRTFFSRPMHKCNWTVA